MFNSIVSYDSIIEKLLFIYFCIMFCHQEIGSLKGIVWFLIILFTAMRIIQYGLVKNKAYHIVVWYGCILFITVLSKSWAISSHPNVGNIISTMGRIFMIVFAMVVYCSEPKNSKKLLKIYYFSCVYFSIVLLATSPLSTYGTAAFSGITGQFKTFIGQIMIFSCIIALYYIHLEGRGHFVSLILFISTALATGSLKAIGGIVFVILLYCYLFFDLKHRMKVLVLGLLAMLVAWNVVMNSPIMYNIFGYRIDNIMSGINADASAFERNYFLEHGLLLIQEKKLLGYGVDGFAETLRRMGYSNPTYSHNNWIELLVSFGVVGFITYYYAYISCILSYFRTKHESSSKLCLMVIIVFCVFEMWFVSFYMYMYVYLIAIVMLVLYQNRKGGVDYDFNNYPNV